MRRHFARIPEDTVRSYWSSAITADMERELAIAGVVARGTQFVQMNQYLRILIGGHFRTIRDKVVDLERTRDAAKYHQVRTALMHETVHAEILDAVREIAGVVKTARVDNFDQHQGRTG